MNLIDASLRAIPISAVAATIIVIAKWRGQPLAAKPEHALWTCVLAAMLAFASPKLTVHAGSPMTPAYSPVAAVAVQQSDFPAISIPNPAQIAPVSAAEPNIWLIIWLAGAGLMTLRIVVGLFLTHRSLADARTITREIPHDATGIARLQESDNAIVPMTIGWPRTRIVLPTSWHTWPNDKLRAVMLHELAHVRRRDALITFLAAINKAIFWFHPLAWWLERRLAELAEFAADDAAVKASIDPRDYASILIDIASGARPTRLRLSSEFAQRGVTRINGRIDRIFDSSARTGSMKIVWTAAALIAAMTLVQFQRPIHAQEPGAQQKPLAFDAASVKPLASAELRSAARSRPTGGPGTGDPGRVHYPMVSPQSLLIQAYGVSGFQIVGPDWLETEWFALDATMPPDTTAEQFRAMLQNLLAERFNLTIHRETKEVSGYSLVVAPKGPKMKKSVETPVPPDDGAPDPPPQPGPDGFLMPPKRAGSYFQLAPPAAARWQFRETTMRSLADELQARLRGPVADATGLTAKYDFTLTISTEGLYLGKGPIHVGQGQAENAPDIFSALQSQLGLKLESGKKVPSEMVVVDHMEKTPTGN